MGATWLNSGKQNGAKAMYSTSRSGPLNLLPSPWCSLCFLTSRQDVEGPVQVSETLWDVRSTIWKELSSCVTTWSSPTEHPKGQWHERVLNFNDVKPLRFGGCLFQKLGFPNPKGWMLGRQRNPPDSLQFLYLHFKNTVKRLHRPLQYFLPPTSLVLQNSQKIPLALLAPTHLLFFNFSFTSFLLNLHHKSSKTQQAK